MSKATILIAAASAATGAALSAALFSSSSSSRRERDPHSTATSAPPTTTLLRPSAPASAPSPLPVPYQQPLSHPPTTPTGPFPVNPSGIFTYGFPGPTADLHPTAALTSSFDRRTRNPHWVAEHITPQSLSLNNADRKHSTFFEDPSIPPKFRGKLSDYFRSGYDRGHQVPAADAKWSQEAMDATFSLSNMCPQQGEGFNRDYWAHFEDFCRRLTSRYPSVRVVTGPLYLPKKDPVDGKWRTTYEVIGNPPNISVPTHFYKIIYGEHQDPAQTVALGAFVLPNDRISNDKPLTDFEVPVEAVERASGLEFVGKLPENRRRRLCQEVACSLLIKDYSQRQKTAVAAQQSRSLSR